MGGKLGKDFDENVRPAPHRKRRNPEGKKKKQPGFVEDAKDRAKKQRGNRQPWRWEDSDFDDEDLDLDGLEDVDGELEDELDEDLLDEIGDDDLDDRDDDV